MMRWIGMCDQSRHRQHTIREGVGMLTLPVKLETQLFGGLRSPFTYRAGRQIYQSRFGLSFEERDSWNHLCCEN
jgi:hypothetical protein